MHTYGVGGVTHETQMIEDITPEEKEFKYEVTACQVYPLATPTGKTKALARITLNDMQLTGLRIVDGVGGLLFVAYPNDPFYKGNDYKIIFYPVTRIRQL